jgi:gluconate 5-dehydrogenase
MKVQELLSLDGKTALVTGGGRGIGRHVALGLAEAGADVFVASRKRAACEEAAAEIARATGRRAVALEADVADPDSVEALAERVLSDCERLDILVNNAGTTWAAPTLTYPLEGWDRVFDVNVRGLWLLSQRVARHMAEAGGGSIVHVSSISAFRGAPDDEQPVVAYSASKGAVISLTTDMAVKLAPHRIRVNCIAPGPFDTDMMNHLRDDEERMRAFLRSVPLGYAGAEDDIKGVAVFLASEASRFVTGQTLCVDGGSTCLYPR